MDYSEEYWLKLTREEVGIIEDYINYMVDVDLDPVTRKCAGNVSEKIRELKKTR